jgi:hypothetical protein
MTLLGKGKAMAMIGKGKGNVGKGYGNIWQGPAYASTSDVLTFEERASMAKF